MVCRSNGLGLTTAVSGSRWFACTELSCSEKDGFRQRLGEIHPFPMDGFRLGCNGLCGSFQACCELRTARWGRWLSYN